MTIQQTDMHQLAAMPFIAEKVSGEIEEPHTANGELHDLYFQAYLISLAALGARIRGSDTAQAMSASAKDVSDRLRRLVMQGVGKDYVLEGAKPDGSFASLGQGWRSVDDEMLDLAHLLHLIAMTADGADSDDDQDNRACSTIHSCAYDARLRLIKIYRLGVGQGVPLKQTWRRWSGLSPVRARLLWPSPAHGLCTRWRRRSVSLARVKSDPTSMIGCIWLVGPELLFQRLRPLTCRIDRN